MKETGKVRPFGVCKKKKREKHHDGLFVVRLNVWQSSICTATSSQQGTQPLYNPLRWMELCQPTTPHPRHSRPPVFRLEPRQRSRHSLPPAAEPEAIPVSITNI